MKTLVSGSSGLVGSAVVEALGRAGHAVWRLARPRSVATGASPGLRKQVAGEVRWDPVAGEFDSAAAEGAEAVVHLAGASIAEGRWNEARKRLLRSSRVEATRHLMTALGKLSQPPRVIVSASAIGYYGDRGDEELTEQSAPGADFLAQLARDWEAEATRAQQFGARVAILRFGVILAANGGALPRMLPPIRWGVGGKLGSGRQWMSWLTLEEAVGVIRYAMERAATHGPVNAVAPNPVRNAEFTAILGKLLHRPTIFAAPVFALRLALGEMAGALLLSSQRVLPRKLQGLGYSFRYPELGNALATILRTAT